MIPKRISVKLFTTDPAAEVDLHKFIPVFHDFIKEKKVEGLLIDVADYSHVPEGPGIVLIGHDVDYSIDLNAGRAGLLTLTKRMEGGSLADLLDDAVRKCLSAVKAVQEDGSTGVSFSTADLRVQLVDRLAAPNSDEGFGAFQADFESLAERVFGDGATIQRADSDEPRRALGVELHAKAAEDLDTLLARLIQSGAQSSRPQSEALTAQQCNWDISVLDLKKLRDEGATFQLIDVREPNEYAVGDIGGELIPLATLPEKIESLDSDAHVVVHCKSGGRSAHAVKLLRANGFTNAWNVQGGLIAWIAQIDPDFPLG